MTTRHHEVPTHLNVEDRVLFGLTARQFLYVLVGASASYELWEQALWLGDVLRTASVAVCLGMTLALALVRPAGRPLEEWLVAALVYAAAPRRAIWQPAEPRPADWRPAGAGWQELAPSLTWAAEEDDG
jgi:hypothetical protein